MTEATFTINELYDEVKRLCETYPDHKYVGVEDGICNYTLGEESDGMCGCLIGTAIMNLDPALQDYLEELDNYDSVPVVATVLFKLGLDTLSYKVTHLGILQRSQDAGMSWGDCWRNLQIRMM